MSVLCIMFRIISLFDVLNGNLYLFHNDSFDNFCFKSLNCDIFIFSIVIPVYISDISFIYLFYIIAVLCESKYFVMHIFSFFYLFA